jgi:hypothetical protein
MVDHEDRGIWIGFGGLELYDIRSLCGHMTFCAIGLQEAGIHAVG